MKILPLAFDSFGVRSMASFIETSSLNILIDPGVALAPFRYGLPPTGYELEALKLARERILTFSEKADVVVVTHYHYDHHPFPNDIEMYKKCFSGKVVFAKDVSTNINISGKKRGKLFEERTKKLAKTLNYADGKTIYNGGVSFSFSQAVWHGDVNSRVGKVIMVEISENGKSIIFGSDAQSLADPEALKWVASKKPDLLILDGYPTILLNWMLKRTNFKEATANLIKAVTSTTAKTIILDHHIVRDINYREKIAEVFRSAKESNKKILTAAEFLSKQNNFLEAWRKEMFYNARSPDVKKYFDELQKEPLEV